MAVFCNPPFSGARNCMIGIHGFNTSNSIDWGICIVCSLPIKSEIEAIQIGCKLVAFILVGHPSPPLHCGLANQKDWNKPYFGFLKMRLFQKMAYFIRVPIHSSCQMMPGWWKEMMSGPLMVNLSVNPILSLYLLISCCQCRQASKFRKRKGGLHARDYRAPSPSGAFGIGS